MNKIQLKLISIFLIISFVLTSCVSPQNNTNTGKASVKENNLFSVKDLPIKNDDIESVKIIEEDRKAHIKITNTRAYPHNLPVNIKGMQISPINRASVVVPPLTQQQINKNREALKKSLITWYRGLYKTVFNTLISIQRKQNKDLEEKFDADTLHLKRNTPQYQLIKENYEKTRIQNQKDHKGQRETFKQAYKKDIEAIKTKSTSIFPKKKKSFSTKDLGLFVFAFGVGLTIIGAINYYLGQFGDFIAGKIFGKKIDTYVAQNPVPDAIPPTQDVNTISSDQQDTYTSYDSSPESQTDPSTTSSYDVTSDTKGISIVPQVDNLGDIINLISKDYGKNSFTLPIKLSTVLEALGTQSGVNVNIDKTRYTKYLCPEEIVHNGGKINRECDYVFLISSKQGEAEITHDRKDGHVIIKFSIANNDITLDKTILNALQRLYGITIDDTQAKNIGDILSNKSISITLKSPQLCKNSLKTEFETGDLVSFTGNISRKILFDGDYTLNVDFKDDKNPANNINNIVDKKINILKELGMTLNDPNNPNDPTRINPYYTGFNDPKNPGFKLPGPLTVSGLGFNQSTSINADRSRINFHINNLTGNFWDMNVSRVRDNSICEPLYTAECVDMSSGDIKLAKELFETGLYKMQANYNIYPDIKAEDTLTHKHDIQFLISNIDYATFSRVSQKPEETNISSNLINDNSYTSLSGFNGDSSYFDLSALVDNGSINNPPDKQVSPSVLLDPAQDTVNPLSAKLVKDTISKINMFGSSNIGLSDEANNLFIDLMSSKNDSINISSYGDFQYSYINECTKDKFVNVGAIVNITDKLFADNIFIYNKDIPIPLKLVIFNTVYPDTDIKSWTFNAKMGTNTVIQKYWDGRPDIKDIDTPPDDGLPSYRNMPGEYKIKVVLDKDSLNSLYDINISNKFNGGAYIDIPLISNKSTNSTFLVVGDGQGACQNISPESLKFFNENINQVVDEVEAMIPDANDLIAYTQPDRLAFDPSGFGIASLGNYPSSGDINNFKELLKNYAKTYREIQDLLNKSGNNLTQIREKLKLIQSLGQNIKDLADKYPAIEEYINSAKSATIIESFQLNKLGIATVYGVSLSLIINEVLIIPAAMNLNSSLFTLQQKVYAFKDTVKRGIKRGNDYCQDGANINGQVITANGVISDLENALNEVRTQQSYDSPETPNIAGVQTAYDSLSQVFTTSLDRGLKTKEQIDQACECKKTGKANPNNTIGDETIKCRIFSIKNISNRQTVVKLLDFLDLKRYQNKDNPDFKDNGKDPLRGKTFAIGQTVDSIGNKRNFISNSSKIKAIGAGIVPTYQWTDYKYKDVIQSEGYSTHAEIKLMEEIYRQFPTDNVSVSIYPDREPCLNCQESVLGVKDFTNKTVKKGVHDITPNITVTFPLISLYKSLENIPTLKEKKDLKYPGYISYQEILDKGK